MYRQQHLSQRCVQRAHQHGFSVIELMVSIAISLLLLAGVVTMFIGSKQSYETTERLSRIQENGRYALDQIVDDLRAAGFQGCARPNMATSRADDYSVTTLNTPTQMLWNFAAPVQGYNASGTGVWTPVLDASITTPANTGPDNISDVIALHVPARDAVALHLTVAQVSGTDPLQVGVVAPPPLKAGDTAMISDCAARAWFQVTDYIGGTVTHAQGGANPGNLSADLMHPFDLGAEIVRVMTVMYYIRPSTADPTVNSLWRKMSSDAGTTTEELAEGIERLEVQYGVDSAGGDGRVDQYVNADGVIAPATWADVISVRVALLARSMDAYGTDRDRETYVLLDPAAPVGPFNDRFQRRVFTTTVALRNQVID
jgi:type IV pilus assembly protein PilW